MANDSELKKGVLALPPLPEVVVELLSMLREDEVHGSRLAQTIARDPALAGATLKLANSSFFGLAGRVSSMQDAITLIGVNAVRNMLLIFGMRNALRPPPGLFDTRAFWLHALESAAAARELARTTSMCRDEAFLAGLMHDLGKLVVACVEPATLGQITDHMREHECSWSEAENAVGSTSHEAAGAFLAEAWRLPESLSAAMSRHHAPAMDDPLIVHLVHLANLVVHVSQGVDGEREAAPPLRHESWQRLAPGEADIERAVIAVRMLHRQSGEWSALLAEP